MKRYWVSWWSGNYANEGCTDPPFQCWISGYRDRRDNSEGNECSMCAMIDADNKDMIWEAISKYFPDYTERFCKERESDAVTGDRFPDFKNRTSLYMENK